MSEKQKQSEICTVINDIYITHSQRSVATWCGRTFDHYFVINLLLNLFWKNFWNSWVFCKVMGENLIALSVLCVTALSCWKMKNSLTLTSSFKLA